MNASMLRSISRQLKSWLCAIVVFATQPVIAVAAPACLAPLGGVGGTGAIVEGGVGGTGNTVSPTKGGVGGTGKSERPANGGVGGTGLQAGGVGGTGIVGTITGFGSVCVNGLEVEYDHSTPVRWLPLMPAAQGQNWWPRTSASSTRWKGR
jgi:hypothetical protein